MAKITYNNSYFKLVLTQSYIKLDREAFCRKYNEAIKSFSRQGQINFK
jgi:hypothetical protein